MNEYDKLAEQYRVAKPGSAQALSLISQMVMITLLLTEFLKIERKEGAA